MNIRPIPTSRPDAYAFHIDGELGEREIECMASTLNDAFDDSSGVRILLRFSDFEGRTWKSRLNGEAVRAQLRALRNADRYAVVGLPSGAESLIDFSDHLLPVEARTFDAEDEGAAWEFIGARPV